MWKFGCLFQVNLLSATDYYGVHVRKRLDYLLKKNLIDFVGSDIHNTTQVSAFNSKIKLKEIVNFRKIIDNNSQFR